MFSRKPRQERLLTTTLEPLIRDRPITRKVVLGTGFVVSGALASIGFGVAAAADYATVYATFNLASEGAGFVSVGFEALAVLTFAAGLEMAYYSSSCFESLNGLRKRLANYNRMKAAQYHSELIWGVGLSTHKVKIGEEQIPDFLYRTLLVSKRNAAGTREREGQRPEE